MRPRLPDSPLLLANAHPFVTTPQHGFGTDALAREVELAGLRRRVPGRHYPHKWRHTYATELVRAGVDIHVVQRLLGHDHIASTVGYLHLGLDDLRSAVAGSLGRRVSRPRSASDPARISPHSEDPHAPAHQMVLHSMRRWRMRTTVTLDDDLMAEVEALTGRRERSALLRLALEALLERESARRLALLGGTDPAAVAAARHRQG